MKPEVRDAAWATGDKGGKNDSKISTARSKCASLL